MYNYYSGRHGKDILVLHAGEHIVSKDGDVISTDTKINTPSELMVGGKKKYLCHPGLYGRRKACKIEEIYPIIRKE